MIPASTNRVHLPSRDKRNDTVIVLNIAARRTLGRRYADMNACRLKDGDANLHWPDNPVKNHFRHIWTGKRNRFGRKMIREMTAAEKNRPVNQWTVAEYRRWCRKVYRGGRWHFAATIGERQVQARRRRVVICWELKSIDYGSSNYAARFVRIVQTSRWTAYYMTLVTMRNWGAKLKAFKLAGGETALLAHDAARPADLAKWMPWIDRIWGRFRR